MTLNRQERKEIMRQYLKTNPYLKKRKEKKELAVDLRKVFTRVYISVAEEQVSRFRTHW